MAFITGVFLIDAQGAALNNSNDKIEGARTKNTSATKLIRTRHGTYPYVSAQAFRYWLRKTLEEADDIKWLHQRAWRDSKIAYTDGNPIKWWDDDLFGYMRAPGESDYENSPEWLTPLETQSDGKPLPITRLSPFRVSTIISIAPVTPTADFGVMNRHLEGDPVPYESHIYSSPFLGLFSLDLRQVGTFTTFDKAGYRNLDAPRIEEALQVDGICEVKRPRPSRESKTEEEVIGYRLPFAERLQRVQSLLKGLGRLQGGARQTLRYNPVDFQFLLTAVTRDGNNIFRRVIRSEDGLPKIHVNAMNEAIIARSEVILSLIHIGRVQGFMDEEQWILDEYVKANEGRFMVTAHPSPTLDALATEIGGHQEWWG